MTFWESTLSSFVGAFFGFLGALIIFFIKEWSQSSARDKATIENLKLELMYNINLYVKFEKKIQECIEAISNDVRTLHLNLSYEFIGTHFAREFYKSGLLLKHFHPDDMRRWNVILSEVGTSADTYITERIDEWCEGKENDKDEMYSSLKLEKDQLAYAREMSQYILQKL